MFKHLKIRTQILLLFASVIITTVIVLLFSLFSIRNSASAAESLYGNIILPLDYIAQSRALMEKVKTDGRSVFIQDTAEVREAMVQSIAGSVGTVKENITEFSKTIGRPEAVEPSQALLYALDRYLLLLDRFAELVREDISRDDIRDDLIDYVDNTLSPVSNECIDYMVALNGIRLNYGEDLINGVTGNVRESFATMIGSSVAGVLLIFLLGIFISLFLSRPILKGAEIMSKAAEGDFSVSLPEGINVETSKLFNACNALIKYSRANVITITKASRTLRESASGLLSVSTVMAENSVGLNGQTARVSSTVEEFSAAMVQCSGSLSNATDHIGAVASSIEEINTNIANAAASAQEASAVMQQSSALVESIQNSISMASDSATLVSGAFDNVAGSVDEINKSIIAINERCASAMQKVSDADKKARNADKIIRQLETAGRQISKVISIISDVADQTNMLSLNAAIEAAGAGEAGKGFMVVAGEVKELARQTADATEEVAEQIENMQRNMPEAVTAVTEIADILGGLSDLMQSLTQEVARQRGRSDQIAEESASSARRMNEISIEIGNISDDSLSVSRNVTDSAHGVAEIAKSATALVASANEIAMNSEQASNNLHAINETTKEMSNGLSDIARSVQFIHGEAGSVMESAGKANRSSEEMLKLANEMEGLIASFNVVV